VAFSPNGQTLAFSSGFEPLLFFFTLVTGPRWSLSLKLSDTRVCEPQIRAHLGSERGFFAQRANPRLLIRVCTLNPEREFLNSLCQVALFLPS